MRRWSTTFFSLGVIAFGCLAASLFPAQARAQQASADAPSLQSLYNSALNFQKAGDLNQAAEQYRQFLAAALDQLANGHSWAGEHDKASALFEQALALTPSSPSLQLDYARAALGAGDPKHAETLARGLLSQEGLDPAGQALAHETLALALRKMFRDQDARKELEASVALDPNFTNQYELAAVCLSIDEEKCAVQAFDWIESSTPDTPELHMTIGLAYGQSDFTPRAVTEFKKVIAEDPRYPEAHYCVAAALLAAGEDEKTLQEAQSQLKEELSISPNDFLTYAALGKIALSYHRNDEAEAYLKRAIALNPKNPDAFLYLGQLDYETSRLKDGEANLRKAIQLTTDESRNHFQIQKAHFLLGRILMQEHRASEAHAEMQIAHAFNDKALSQDKNKLAAMLPASGAVGGDSTAPAASSSLTPKHADPDAAQKLKALEGQLTPPIADSYNNLGVITASQNRFAEALLYFKQAYVWQPSLEGLDYNMGRAAFMAAEFAHAVPPLTRYLRAHPQDSAMRAPLAMSQFMAGNYPACLEALKAAPQSVSSMPQMQLIYAQSLVRTGQVASGFARLQSLEKANPNDPGVHRGLGEVYILRRNWLDATRELAQAIRLMPNDPEAHYDLGKAELATGDIGAATDELQTAVSLMPRDPRFHQELAAAYERNFRLADAAKERQLAEQLKSSQTPPEKPASASSKPSRH